MSGIGRAVGRGSERSATHLGSEDGSQRKTGEEITYCTSNSPWLAYKRRIYYIFPIANAPTKYDALLK